MHFSPSGRHHVASGVIWLCLIVVGLNAQTAATPYFFDTLAGRASAGTKDGPVSEAQFFEPEGVAVDAAGNLYVANSGSYTLRKISPAGVVSTLAGKPGSSGIVDGAAAIARFYSMQDVAVDKLGTIYVADVVSIRKLGLDGQVSTLAGWSGGNEFPGPLAQDGTGTNARFNSVLRIAIDPAGGLYATDSGANAVRRITPTGEVSTVAGRLNALAGASDGVGTAAGFFAPAGIAVDAGGAAYVAEVGSHRLRRVQADGTVTALAGRTNEPGADDGVGSAASFRVPDGVAVDVGGNLAVADRGNGIIRRVTPAGQVTTLAGQPPPAGGVAGGTNLGSADGTGSAAKFHQPGGVAYDAAGNLFVTDPASNQIRKVTPAGVVTTVAGTSPSQSTGMTDGAGAAARFSGLRGVGVAPNGVVFVADSFNHTIRRISPAGEVTTFAGKAGVAGYVDGSATVARFHHPTDIAVDANGNVYVLDDMSVVRRITPEGMVSTLAGNPNAEPGSRDGRGAEATFYSLMGIAIAPDGAIWVGEGGLVSDPITRTYAQLRRITLDGVVTTDRRIIPGPHTYFRSLAIDREGTLYATDGSYSVVHKLPSGAAQSEAINFPNFSPLGVAAGPDGDLFFSGTILGTTHRVGRFGRDGRFDFVAGFTGHRSCHQDGLGSDAGFAYTTGIAVSASGVVYVSCADNTIRRGRKAGAPVVETGPQSQTVNAGATVQFSVTASAIPAPTYQWRFKGADIAGATNATYSIAAAQAANAGEYTVVVTNSLGSATSAAASLTVSAGGGSGGGNGGGGGGAPSLWFVATLAALGVARGLKRRAGR